MVVIALVGAAFSMARRRPAARSPRPAPRLSITFGVALVAALVHAFILGHRDGTRRRAAVHVAVRYTTSRTGFDDQALLCLGYASGHRRRHSDPRHSIEFGHLRCALSHRHDPGLRQSVLYRPQDEDRNDESSTASSRARDIDNTYIVLDSKGRYVTKRTSSDDLALLLARLEQGALLSEEGTNEFTKRLLAQIWRQRISSGVAAGTVVGSKSGQLWVPSGMVEADTAIIHGPNSTYVLTVIGTHGAVGTTVRGSRPSSSGTFREASRSGPVSRHTSSSRRSRSSSEVPGRQRLSNTCRKALPYR